MSPNQKYTKEERKDMDNHLKSIGILFRTILRKDKIKKIFNDDRKEK
jgi:hypothetical protein